MLFPKAPASYGKKNVEIIFAAISLQFASIYMSSKGMSHTFKILLQSSMFLSFMESFLVDLFD